MTPEGLKERLRPQKKNIQVFSFSNVVATISILISLTGTAATIYYNYYWNPEDLRVHFRGNDIGEVGTNSVGVHFTFTNAGKQAVSIGTISLIQVEGDEVELATCQNRFIRELVEPRPFPSVAEGERVSFLGRGIEATIYNPSEAIIDNTKVVASALLVEAGKPKLLSAVFKPRVVDLGKMRVAHCFMIRFYDRKGKLHNRVLPGWFVSYIMQIPTGVGRQYGLSLGVESIRLLPVQ